MFVSSAIAANATIADNASVATTIARRGRPGCVVSLIGRRLPLSSAARAVPDAAVAMDAAPVVFCSRAGDQGVVNEVAMAAQAVVLQDLRVARLDQDRFVEVLQGEPLGVVVAVQGLREVLADRLVWQVAIHAARVAVVRPLGPRRVLVVHD